MFSYINLLRQKTSNKNRQIGPNQAYKLLQSQGTINRIKRQPMEWEKNIPMM